MAKVKAAEFFKSFQLGVACCSRAETIAHGSRAYVDKHRHVDDFVVLMVDMENALNIVLHKAILGECRKHFPGLSWATWYHSQHPILWHPMGCMQSEQGVFIWS